MDAGAGRRPGGATVLVTFLYVWLMVGFFTGTVLLVGPMKWMTAWMRGSGVSQAGEDAAVKGVILGFVVASALLSRMLVGTIWRARTRPARMRVPAAVTLAAGVSLWAWMNPGRMLASVGGGMAGEVARAGGAEFVFGAYPDAARLAELKAEGISAVVSLQHPAVVPFEPASIAEERRNTARLGIRFIHAPMLPWVSDNEASLETIRQLAREGKGRFYVHCGLGRDRTNVARRVVEAEGARVKASGTLAKASTLADRREPFERGRVAALEPGVWLMPYPNDAEMAGYLLAGQVRSVALLLDPADPTQAAWIAEARRRLEPIGVRVVETPVRGGDAAAAARAAAAVRGLPRPAAVIAARTPYDVSFPATAAADAFQAAYLRGVAPDAREAEAQGRAMAGAR